ncbi:MAG: peptide-methionine (S)-S-oxide reductase MsrA [Anaerolineales bacterium]
MDKNRSGVQGESKDDEVATFGGGCFWCLEAVFQNLEGVKQVISGYAGGDVVDPTYEQVCTGSTGHAEVVQITYDPLQVSYEFLLDVFFSIHDPTTLNRQGADVGTQYRSVIFYQNEQQEETARRKIQEIGKEGIWERPVVTQLKPLKHFYPAEDYHQNYYKKNPFAGYCRAVISPKVVKFRAKFAERLKQ